MIRYAIPRERLTARERFSLLLIDEIPDRVVIYPLVTAHAATVYGCSVRDYCCNGKILAEAQLRAWREYGHDAISVFTGVGLIAEAFGSRLAFPDDDIPSLLEPCVEQLEQIADLKLPHPERTARLPVYLEAIELTFEAVGDRVPILAFIPAPFTTAAQLRGISQFLKDTLKNPEAAHQMLQLSTAAAVELIDACMVRGALPLLADPLASASVISPNTFRDFALPYLKQLIDYMHRFDLDVILHICGRTELLHGLIPATHTDLFSFDQNDETQTRSCLGDTIRLIGNVAPSALLHLRPEEITELVKEKLHRLKTTPKGFVLATGCEVPIAAPPENVRAFVQAGKQFGFYD